MLEILRRYLETARTYWTGLSRTQQVLVLAMVLSLVAGVATLLVWAGRTEYATLFASLTPEDTGAIVSQLKAAKIPYRVDEASGVVQVPSRQVYETRLKLASQGLPTGGGVGFELFDKTSFGVTDFAQKLNFQRALQTLEKVAIIQEVELPALPYEAVVQTVAVAVCTGHVGRGRVQLRFPSPCAQTSRRDPGPTRAPAR